MAKVNMPRREPPKKVFKPEVASNEDEFEEVEVVKNDEPTKFVVANCRSLNVRSEPTKESRIVAEIQNGTFVYVDPLYQDSSWLHITGFGNGDKLSSNSKAGYILAEYTSEA